MGKVMITNLAVSIASMVLGVFVATSPARAARIWASERLENLAPQERASLLRWFRALGLILCLGGALFALDSSGFWD
jgi:hypothetical protein